MTRDIVITHRVFPETLALLNDAGNVCAPSDDRLGKSELTHCRPHALP